MFVAGEHCDIETSHWTQSVFGSAPVLDNWWQTETGWAITCTNVGLGNRLDPPAGCTGVPVPGWNGMLMIPAIQKFQGMSKESSLFMKIYSQDETFH